MNDPNAMPAELADDERAADAVAGSLLIAGARLRLLARLEALSHDEFAPPTPVAVPAWVAERADRLIGSGVLGVDLSGWRFEAYPAAAPAGPGRARVRSLRRTLRRAGR